MKIQHKALLCLLIYTFFAHYSTFAQSKSLSDAHITGHVIDAKSNEHIPFVAVGIKGTTQGAVSDASGHFLLKNLTPGKHILSASCIGYQMQEKEVEIFPNKTIEIFFELKPEMLELNEVVVSASRNETKKRESSTIVNVLSSKLFEKTASCNVAEVLNFQSGLRVEYNCSNCGVPQLRINGLAGQYSQILLDSRPIFSSLASVYGLEQLPAGMIERVEVIRGGGSALFGSSAIGGVVNIITKEPLCNSLSLSNQSGFYQGSGHDINTTLNASLVSDDFKTGIYVFGMMKNRSPYDRNTDGFSEIPKLNSETIGFRAMQKIGSSSRLTLEYHHIHEFRRGGNFMDRPAHEADIAEQLEHNIDGGGLKYDFLSTDLHHHASAYVSLQNVNRNSYFGTQQNLDAYGKTKDFTFVAGGQYMYSFDRFLFMPAEMTAGIEYTSNKLNDQMLGYNRQLEQKSDCFGGYFQNEWKNKKWSILIGARLDKHNMIKNPVFVPRLNFRYSPTDAWAFRLSYASGYRAPQAYEEDLHVAAVGGEVAIITLDPNLQPEYSHSISGSIDFYQSVGSFQWNILCEGFYTQLNDVFTLVENGRDTMGNLFLQRRNASGAYIGGVNLEAKMAYGKNWIFEMGFTWQKSMYKDPLKWSENENLAPQKRMFRSPDVYGFASLQYFPITPLSLSATLQYTGPMLVQHYAGYIPEDQEQLTKNFWDMGFRAAYKWKLTSQLFLELSAGVKNIFDAFQPDLDLGIDKDAGYIYGPASPRTYFVGVKFMM